jgi:hypothetical protein
MSCEYGFEPIEILVQKELIETLGRDKPPCEVIKLLDRGGMLGTRGVRQVVTQAVEPDGAAVVRQADRISRYAPPKHSRGAG